MKKVLKNMEIRFKNIGMAKVEVHLFDGGRGTVQCIGDRDFAYSAEKKLRDKLENSKDLLQLDDGSYLSLKHISSISPITTHPYYVHDLRFPLNGPPKKFLGIVISSDDEMSYWQERGHIPTELLEKTSLNYKEYLREEEISVNDYHELVKNIT